jgi:hypothetical protein
MRFAGIGPEAVKTGRNVSWARSGIRTIFDGRSVRHRHHHEV